MDVFNPFKTPTGVKERVKKFTAQEREQSATSISCQYDDEPKANNTNSPYIKILQILT